MRPTRREFIWRTFVFGSGAVVGAMLPRTPVKEEPKKDLDRQLHDLQWRLKNARVTCAEDGTISVEIPNP